MPPSLISYTLHLPRLQKTKQVGACDVMMSCYDVINMSGVYTGPVALELPDVQKLKRNIALLCDRMNKGGRLSASAATPTAATPTTTATVALATQSLERKSSQHISKSQLGKLPPLPESSTEEQEDGQMSEL